MASVVSEHSWVSIAPGQVCSNLGSEVVILNVAAGSYFGLDGVGARVWELIQETARVGDVRDAIVAEYDVESARCTRDVLALLEEMRANGLIQVRNREIHNHERHALAAGIVA